MLIDHTGSYIFPDILIFRIIGRLSLPLYSYCLIQGIKKTKDCKAYFIRLYGIAILAQIILWSFDPQKNFNILFLFCIFFIAAKLRQKYNPLWYLIGAIIEYIPIDYGLYGFLLLIIIYETWDKKINHYMLPFVILLNTAEMIKTGSYMQFFSSFSIFIISYYNKFKDKIKLNKYIFYAFYPGHLLILNIIKILLKG